MSIFLTFNFPYRHSALVERCSNANHEDHENHFQYNREPCDLVLNIDNKLFRHHLKFKKKNKRNQKEKTLKNFFTSTTTAKTTAVLIGRTWFLTIATQMTWLVTIVTNGLITVRLTITSKMSILITTIAKRRNEENKENVRGESNSPTNIGSIIRRTTTTVTTTTTTTTT